LVFSKRKKVLAPKHFEIRPVKIKRGFTKAAPGSVLFSAGETVILCTASVEEKVPPWLEAENKGWVTAEYNMLPGCTNPRKQRERMKIDGRTNEIQRLIGRSLRAVVDLQALGPRQIVVDCEVLRADGGTRTASITGGFIALVDAIRSIRKKLPNPEVFPLHDSIAAISAGIVDGEVRLDLDYLQDVGAEVDMNVVMTGRGKFVEIQGTGEEATFDDAQLAALLAAAKSGIKTLTAEQKSSLGKAWPW
jgi:ribonuclease PH